MHTDACIKTVVKATCLVTLSVGWLVLAHAECTLSDIPPTEIGRREIIEKSLLPGETRLTVSPPDARYVRVLIEATRLSGDGKAKLIIRDKFLRPVQVLRETEFLGQKSFWSTRIYGDKVILDLDTGGSSINLRALGYIAMPEEAEPKQSLYSVADDGNHKFKNLYDGTITKNQLLGDHVGLVLGSFGNTTWTCSGVLLTARHLITNWHCGGLDSFKPEDYWSDTICKDTLVDMSWDGDQVSRDFSCRRVIAKDRDTDFAVIELMPVNTNTTLRAARFRDTGPMRGQDVRIIQHPAGRIKQITECKVQQENHVGWISKEQIDFTYDCDTAGGSSGSPVFDEGGSVIGIHHYGYKVEPKSCQALDQSNKAIQIAAVFRRLRQLGYKSLLREVNTIP